jgi:hypothetical protein
MKYQFIDLGKHKGPIPWGEARELTPEEEVEIIAQYKASINFEEMEAEYMELMRQHERGELIDAEDLLRQIQAGLQPEKPK